MAFVKLGSYKREKIYIIVGGHPVQNKYFLSYGKLSWISTVLNNEWHTLIVNICFTLSERAISKLGE